MISALRVADGAVILVDSVAGLEVGTEIDWGYCETFKVPRFLVINKMDRDNADFKKALTSVQEFSPIRLIPVQLPWGERAAFKGVIDLISMKAYAGDGKISEEIPAELKSAAEEARTKLVEAAAEGEDSLLEKYLESGELTNEELMRGLKAIVRSETYIPVFVAAGGHEKGVLPLLEAVINLIPSPKEKEVVALGKAGEEKLTASDTGPWTACWKRWTKIFTGTAHGSCISGTTISH